MRMPVNSNSSLFTSSGTFVTPKSISIVYVTGSGGGGGGGGCGTGASVESGGGGGAGETVWRMPVTVTPGTSYTVTLGVSGTGGAQAVNGNNGGTTTFGALLSLPGGTGGTAGGATAGAYGGGGASGGPGAGGGGSGDAYGLKIYGLHLMGPIGGWSPISPMSMRRGGVQDQAPYGCGGSGGMKNNLPFAGGHGGPGLMYVEW